MKLEAESCTLLMGFSSVERGEPRPKGHRRKVLVLTKFGMFIKEAGQEGREAKKKRSRKAQFVQYFRGAAELRGGFGEGKHVLKL